jgi:putative phosphoribosyl transferase
MRYRDRRHAGEQLADRVAGLGLTRPIILGLPRGGVPVAAAVASRLHAPLEAFVACKVGAPSQPEFGIGAIAEGRDQPVVTAAVSQLGLDGDRLQALVAAARDDLARRVTAYRGERPLPELTGADVVVADDGLATGVTAEAALRSLRLREPRRLVLAAPVCAPDTAERLAALADDVVCLQRPASFFAVGEWYVDFRQTSDAEVLRALAGSAHR